MGWMKLLTMLPAQIIKKVWMALCCWLWASPHVVTFDLLWHYTALEFHNSWDRIRHVVVWAAHNSHERCLWDRSKDDLLFLFLRSWFWCICTDHSHTSKKKIVHWDSLLVYSSFFLALLCHIHLTNMHTINYL